MSSVMLVRSSREASRATSDLAKAGVQTDMFRSLETSLSTLPSSLSNVNTELTTTARSVSTASSQFTSAATDERSDRTTCRVC